MDVGVALFPTDRTVRPDRLAAEVEARGFESLWFPEHTHIPVTHSPYPGGGHLPDHYRRTYDPFVALAVAATATATLRVGTGICLLAQRDPIVTAKEVASLDVLSGGRFLFGVGYGWNRPETEQHGVAFGDRRAVVHERIRAMRALWTDDEADFDGDHVRFAPSWSWPKPAQQPHPPVLLGAAAGPRTFDRVVEDCDGWMPIPGRGGSLSETVPRFRERATAAGRDLPVTAFGAKPDAATLERYLELGVDRVVWWLPQAEEEVLGALDRFAALAGDVRG